MRRPPSLFALVVGLTGPLAAAERLDPTLITVLGGGLSAGYSGFRLTQQAQQQAWPSLVARQMGTILPLPTIRENGPAGVINAFRPLPGLLPTVAQSGERALPFPFFNLNLSVPFLRVAEALRTRPSPQYDGPKLIASIEGDLKGSLMNAILGGPLLTLEKPVLKTQVEYAEMLSPTLVFVQLGFEDVLDAALQADRSRITGPVSFRSDYEELLRRMAGTHATVVVMTVPDPIDTAYFSPLESVARKYRVTAEELRSRFGLAESDVVTLGGLIEIGDTLRGRRSGPLNSGSVLPAAVASAIRDAVREYNSVIRAAAGTTGAKVFDLGDFLRQVRANGARAGRFAVGGGYGEGFYSEDGLFPGSTGQALIANAVLQLVNSTFGTGFAAVDAEAIASRDPLIETE